MVETLLTPSSIKLYGRLVKGLSFDSKDTNPFGGNYFLQRQFTAFGTITLVVSTVAGSPTLSPKSLSGLAVGQTVTGDPAIIPAGATIASIPPIVVPPAPTTFDLSAPALAASPSTVITINTGAANFARIYAFSFEGAIYPLPKPAIFLVHGTGLTIDASIWRGGRSSLEQSGVLAREWEFSGDDNLAYWEYEKGDFSLRLDTEAGPFEQILLMGALRAGADSADRSRAGMQVSGMQLGSGMQVSGMQVSGMQVGYPNKR